MKDQIYDVIGIGFGVSNIGLAISLKESNAGVSMLFIEANADSLWQPNMLIRGADIQNSPHRDLITPNNPRSKYTFMNYLFEHGRLFEYFNLNITHPLRTEYADYIKWCSEDFKDHVIYNERANSISHHATDGVEETVFEVATNSGKRFFARNISIGTGRQVNIPAKFQHVRNCRISHLTQYSVTTTSIPRNESTSIAVIGSGQSAIEIILDLNKRFPESRITNICNGFGYRLKDTSPFSYEAFYPEFIDFFYSLPPNAKEEVTSQLRATNYSTVDGDVLHELYLSMYEDRLVGAERISLRKNSNITHVIDHGRHIEIGTTGKHDGRQRSDHFDFVFLATGFIDYQLATSPLSSIPLLENIARALGSERFSVSRDYRIESKSSKSCTEGSIYLNGLCEMTHGMGDAGSISSVSTRCSTIARSLIATLSAPGRTRDEGTVKQHSISAQ